MPSPIEPIPSTAAGWPYLPDTAPVADQPAYTRALAAALNGFTPGPAVPFPSPPALPKARAERNTTGPSWSASAFVQVTGFTSKPYDEADLIDADTGVITIPTAGLWRIEFSGHMPNYSGVYRRRLLIFKGLAASGAPVGELDVGSSGRLGGTVSAEEVCAAGDKFTVWLWSDTANSTGLNPTEANAVLTKLTVRKVMN
jgi:hypothetical protein